MRKWFYLSLPFVLAACATGESHRPNVYSSSQINQIQEVKTVNIISILPAKIEVDNSRSKNLGAGAGALAGGVLGGALGDRSNNTATGAIAGGLLGAVTGGLIAGDKSIVHGVSITYSIDNRTLNSVQVGRPCEYKIGGAVMISSHAGESRIQPNSVCAE